MKKVLIVLVSLMVATAVFAQAHHGELNTSNNPNGFAGGGGSSGNLTFHTGGGVIRNPNVGCICWGPAFTGPDAGYASPIQGFRNQFGTAGAYNTVTQDYGN